MEYFHLKKIEKFDYGLFALGSILAMLIAADTSAVVAIAFVLGFSVLLFPILYREKLDILEFNRNIRALAEYVFKVLGPSTILLSAFYAISGSLYDMTFLWRFMSPIAISACVKAACGLLSFFLVACFLNAVLIWQMAQTYARYTAVVVVFLFGVLAFVPNAVVRVVSIVVSGGILK